MRIVITDSGSIWNHENPYLEQFKDIVLVVCLWGRKVTDKYQCFVSPYRNVGMGAGHLGVEDRKLQALASAGKKLNAELGYRDDIVFLADGFPETLYPFYVLKDFNKYNRLHLVALSPWKFEGERRCGVYNQMLSDLTALQSILYYDSDSIWDAVGQSSTMREAFDYAGNFFGEFMPKVLNGIYDMRGKRCYFDFASMTYVPLESGFDQIDITKKNRTEKEIKFPMRREFSLLGKVFPPAYPQDNDYVKQEIERPVARLDGKKICTMLREQRMRLAEANQIPFRSEECPSVGPCAGTCEKCDMESRYLRKQLQKIPEEQRIYPEFDLAGEVLL